jgi:hypothetical protein
LARIFHASAGAAQLAGKSRLFVFHSNTERLLDYWRAKRGADAIPRRSSIDPTQVLDLLPGLFMLGREGAGRYPFRLVGLMLDRVHARSLRNEDFLNLWRGDNRMSLQMAMETVRRRGEPLVITAEVWGESGQSMTLEIALAPVAGADGQADRFFGLYQPTSPVEVLEDQPILRMSIRAIAAPDSADGVLPRLRLAAANGSAVEDAAQPGAAWSRRPA